MKYKELVSGECYQFNSHEFLFCCTTDCSTISISADYEIIIDAKIDRAYEVQIYYNKSGM